MPASDGAVCTLGLFWYRTFECGSTIQLSRPIAKAELSVLRPFVHIVVERVRTRKRHSQGSRIRCALRPTSWQKQELPLARKYALQIDDM